MKIIDVATHVLEAPLSEPFGWSFSSTSVRASCIVEIRADDGTTGWSECYGPARINAAIVAAFKNRCRDGLPPGYYVGVIQQGISMMRIL